MIYVRLEIQTTLVISGMEIELVDKENLRDIEAPTRREDRRIFRSSLLILRR
jgi:hypothetical protein